MKHFNFTFIEQMDGKYGNYDNVTKKWNGMLGRLMVDPVGTRNTPYDDRPSATSVVV